MVGGFSLGMGQRLGLASALLGNPQTVILDEPVNGLDPEGVRWIRTTLKELAADGHTVFVSSHLMSEMAQTATRLVVVGRGRLIADTTVDEFVARASNHSVTVRTPETARLRELLLGTFGGRRGAVRDRRGMTALALGALLRHTAAAITTFVAVFFVIPPLTLLPAWLTDHFVQFLPSNTGVVMVGGNFGVAHPLGALDRVRGDLRLRGGPDRVRRLAAASTPDLRSDVRSFGVDLDHMEPPRRAPPGRSPAAWTEEDSLAQPRSSVKPYRASSMLVSHRTRFTGRIARPPMMAQSPATAY